MNFNFEGFTNMMFDYLQKLVDFFKTLTEKFDAIKNREYKA